MDDGRAAGRGGGGGAGAGGGSDRQCFVTAGNDCVLRCWNMGSYSLQAELTGKRCTLRKLM